MKDHSPPAVNAAPTNHEAAVLRVLIADDHAALREGLKQMLSELDRPVEFGESGTTQATFDMLSSQQWDLLILDIFMPGRSGLEVLHEVRRTCPPIPVLVLSSAPEEQLAIRVLKAGAAGFLNKRAVAEELLTAVTKIYSGERYFSSRVAEKLVNDFGEKQPPHQRLSNREYQVMRMLVGGKSLKEIAAELSLSPKTIATFHGRILDKLGLSNDVQLVHYALDHQLIEPKGV